MYDMPNLRLTRSTVPPSENKNGMRWMVDGLDARICVEMVRFRSSSGSRPYSDAYRFRGLQTDEA